LGKREKRFSPPPPHVCLSLLNDVYLFAVTSTLMNILDLLYFFEKMRGQWKVFHAVFLRM
jgi:hypothetical protein